MDLNSLNSASKALQVANQADAPATTSLLKKADLIVHGAAAVVHIFPFLNLASDAIAATYGAGKYGAGFALEKLSGTQRGSGLKASGLVSMTAAGASVGTSILNTFLPVVGWGGVVFHGSVACLGTENCAKIFPKKD